MHDGDKFGWSAFGKLIRTKNKIPVNYFPEGVNIMEKKKIMHWQHIFPKHQLIKRIIMKCLRNIPVFLRFELKEI